MMSLIKNWLVELVQKKTTPSAGWFQFWKLVLCNLKFIHYIFEMFIPAAVTNNQLFL